VEIWRAILDEAWENRTPFVVAGLFLTIVAIRVLAPREERRRVRAMVVLVALHLVCLPILGALRVQGTRSAYHGVLLASLAFEVLAVVAMSSTVLFAGLLPRVGLRTPRILRDVIGAAVSVIAIIVVAKRAGFPLSGLITTSAVLTAVIGFSLQDTLGNIMGGLALQLDNSVQVGDWVKVGDVSGRVVEIRWRYTSIETRNWETVIVPNSMLMRGQVTVQGRRQGEPLQWRRWVYFNIDFRYQPSEVMHAVTDALRAAPIQRVADTPEPHCILMDFHESYARYAVRYWLTDPGIDDPTDSEVRTRIYFALKRVGIPLSIPAHTVFMTEDTEARRAEKDREEQQRRRAALDKVDIFDELSDAEKEQLAHSLRYAPFTRGEVMTKQGAEAHWLYMIVEGEAVVRVAVEGGLDREVARLKAGSFFGEMSLMTGAPRSATVTAASDVECYRLDKEAFQEIIRVKPQLAENVADILARRRAELVAARENLDTVARERRMQADKSDILDRIRDFFGLADGRRVA
jgi:small-conductance mechanosensitive channel/CRP-like cAMP-binding protein